MVKKECFNKAGYFDENLPARQDYDMWLSISRFYEFTFIDEELVYIYRNGHEAISSNYKKHIEGTKMVLNKIYSYLSNEELYKYKKSIDNSQYNYIALVCMRNEDYKLAKNYIIKAIKSKKNYESILIMLCSYVPIIFKMLRNIKRSRLANLRRNKEKFKRCI